MVFERRVPKEAEENKSDDGNNGNDIPTTEDPSPIPDPIEVPSVSDPLKASGPMSPGVTLGRGSSMLNSPDGTVPEAFVPDLYDIDEGEREFDSDGK